MMGSMKSFLVISWRTDPFTYEQGPSPKIGLHNRWPCSTYGTKLTESVCLINQKLDKMKVTRSEPTRCGGGRKYMEGEPLSQENGR